MRAVAVADEDELSVEDALDAVRAQPRMEGQALVAQVSTREPYVFSEGTPRSRARRLRDEALDPAPAREGGRRRDRLPALGAARRARALPGVVLSNGPGDPEPLRAETEAVRGLLGTVPGARHLPRTPAARPRDRARDLQAPLRPSRSQPSGARQARGRVLVTSQNHGFAVAPTESEEATHVSLYDGTVEGLRLPGAASALGAIPPRGRARPARRLGDPRRLGRGARRR